MNGYADQSWTEAMFADVQRQIDELWAQLRALATVVHAHTLASLAATPAEADPHGTGRSSTGHGGTGRTPADSPAALRPREDRDG